MSRTFIIYKALLGMTLSLITVPVTAQDKPAPVSAMPAGHAELVSLFADWRRFVRPSITAGVPDYGTAAIARMARELPRYQARLKAIDRTGWNATALGDHALIEAEMNGLDFNIRVLKPWARDPSFYATVFADESDVPAHEGPSATPNIDLFAYKFPLSRKDDQALTILIGAIPALLNQARANLAESNGRDLWAYGDRAFAEQSAILTALGQGTLMMRTLEGRKKADMEGASPALLDAVAAARKATDDFAKWVSTQAPRKTGPSGVGKENYDWYLKHVELNPYSFDQQVSLLQRELDRSLASLRLEELRNRNLPPIGEIVDPAAYRKMAEAKTARFNDFLVSTGFVPNKPYFRASLEAQTSDYTPPAERNFFSYGTSLDPLPLLSHSTHWIELARLKHEPHPSPIRQAAPLFNIFADRSEGLATAVEEIVMHASLYDDNPRAREIVWIMLANRAARGLASLRVQANEIDLAEAGRFHADWTPRRWSDPASPLVGFEQLLYLRQPGYGPSYIIGKLQFDSLFAQASHQADRSGKPFVMHDMFGRIMAAGIIPPALIERELFATGQPSAQP